MPCGGDTRCGEAVPGKARLQHDPGMSAVSLRHDLRPGDVGAIVSFHGLLYAREQGFDVTFEAYVARPLAEMVLRASPRERAWLAEAGDRLVGCAAIVESSPEIAQFRWFLVDPSVRGQGVGKRLVAETNAFAREQGYASIILWTVAELQAAAHVYRSAGFVRVEEKPGRHWGVDGVEEKYELRL